MTGMFRWDALPELLQIPPETGIVRLRPVPHPRELLPPRTVSANP